MDEWELRPIAVDDLPVVLEWRNSERIRANMYTDHLISPAEHRQWFARTREDDPPRFLIFCHRGRPLGVVNFTAFDAVNGTAHWGFYLGCADAPAGSGGAMGCLALQYAFDRLGIRKLIGEAFSFNQGSLAYHRKLGFREEAHFVRHVLKEGRYQDVISFALFRDDWQAGRGRLEAKYLSGNGGDS